MPTEIEGVYVITPTRFKDSRGYFAETYNKSDFEAAGLKYNFIQDNESQSTKGVLRGLHFQKNFPQAKLVRCTEGEVFDVCVDLRPKSKTYKKYFSIILSATQGNQLLIPRGFAHGFLVLSDLATFCYKCDNLYHPEDAAGINYADPQLNISWPNIDSIKLSSADAKLPFMSEEN